MRDITLHDGTRIPKGTRVSANVHAHHHDPALLAHADTFNAFRYARMRSVDVGGESSNISKTDNLWKSGRSGWRTPPKWTPSVDHHAGTRLAQKLSGGLPGWSIFGCQTFRTLKIYCGEHRN